MHRCLAIVAMLFLATPAIAVCSADEPKLNWDRLATAPVFDTAINSHPGWKRLAIARLPIADPTLADASAVRRTLVLADAFSSLITQAARRDQGLQCGLLASVQPEMTIQLYAFARQADFPADKAAACLDYFEIIILKRAYSDNDLRLSLHESLYGASMILKSRNRSSARTATDRIVASMFPEVSYAWQHHLKTEADYLSVDIMTYHQWIAAFRANWHKEPDRSGLLTPRSGFNLPIIVDFDNHQSFPREALVDYKASESFSFRPRAALILPIPDDTRYYGSVFFGRYRRSDTLVALPDATNLIIRAVIADSVPPSWTSWRVIWTFDDHAQLPISQHIAELQRIVGEYQREQPSSLRSPR